MDKKLQPIEQSTKNYKKYVEELESKKYKELNLNVKEKFDYDKYIKDLSKRFFEEMDRRNKEKEQGQCQK